MNGENGNGKKREAKPPKPRKNALLWQAWQHWDELVKMRAKHNQRLAFIEQGKSNLDAGFERNIAESLDPLIPLAVKEMASYGACVGPVWEWLTAIKGIGDSLAAQLLAQIDDIMLFATVSKLWRFAGWAVFDGKRERPVSAEERHYSTRLKSTVWLIVHQFILQQTPVWSDLYYAEKARLRALHPEPEPAREGSRWPFDFTDSHVDRMAQRRVAKEFLKQLWIVWRASEPLGGVDMPAWDPMLEKILTEDTGQRAGDAQ